MEIYITNFWYAVNYGANLTAYALYKLINDLYGQVYLNNNLKLFEKISCRQFYVKNFFDKYCQIKKYNKRKNVILITGSDQVFNPNCEPEYHHSNMLNFAKMGDKKIAFSASFGVDKEQFVKENSPKTIENMKQSLKSFDFISVREKSGVEICKDLFDVEAECIIDPVFILDRKYWEQLISKSNVNTKGKIVSYFFNKTKQHHLAYKYLSKKYSLPIIELATYKYSPEDWLSAIKNCEFLITNSFHGICFAIIFNKKFICLSKETNKSARFESLFELLHIKNKSVSLDEIYNRDCIFDVDYDLVNKIILQEQQKGLNFLKKVLTEKADTTEEKIVAKQKAIDNYAGYNFSFNLPKIIWKIWLIIYFKYLPNQLKNVINYFWHKIKRN